MLGRTNTVMALGLASAICVALTAFAQPQTLVLSYADFGPPSMAHRVIGMDWPSWQNHGDSEPGARYKISVVVYRRIPLDEVKRRYPVDKENQQDFRYIEHSHALKYLETVIKELRDSRQEVLRRLKERLVKTKKRITKELGPLGFATFGLSFCPSKRLPSYGAFFDESVRVISIGSPDKPTFKPNTKDQPACP